MSVWLDREIELLELREQEREKQEQLRARAWPDLLAPPMHECPVTGWEDPALPDIKLIWKLAREVGYAVGVHGSLKRDVDLIAVPWTEDAAGHIALINHLCKGLNAKQAGSPSLEKPHGRLAVIIQIDGYYKPIDLSIMPRIGEPNEGEFT